MRGVSSDGVIASLKEKRLIREVGREADRGGAALFGTTAAFLDKFGLKTLRDLPPLEDFAPDEEARQFIRERLSGRSIGSTLEETAADLDEEAALLDEDSAYESTQGVVGGASDWVSEDLAGDDDERW